MKKPFSQVALSRRFLMQSVGAIGVLTVFQSSATLARSHLSPRLKKVSPVPNFSPIIELRQYTLHPGTRETFTRLFEREFIEPQEAVGIKVIGQFVDADDPDRFVWLRGFPNMETRKAGLEAFYGGDLWKAHRSEANSSINDSDNVLFLKETGSHLGFPANLLASPPVGASEKPGAVLLASIHYLDRGTEQQFSDFFTAKMRPHLVKLGVTPIAQFVSETRENNFKGLPVRSDETVFIWFAQFANLRDCDRHLAAMRTSQGAWREGAPELILRQLARKPEILRLIPTARSALRVRSKL